MSSKDQGPSGGLRIEYVRGSGPGGQHRNKKATTVRITHLETGLQVTVGGRSRAQNKRQALKEIQALLEQKALEEAKEDRQKERDRRIRESETIRTYDFKRQVVKDHRTKREEPLDRILNKGEIWRFYE